MHYDRKCSSWQQASQNDICFFIKAIDILHTYNQSFDVIRLFYLHNES